jgi:DNA invertase Pin-like site-specific DNA recombinase
MNKHNGTGLMKAGQQKITVEHWQRRAYIYVRQSSPKQVRLNRESQHNQYGLVERAEALGWDRDRVRVIDADQGRSAVGSDYRDGFQELVAEVSLRHVGIIFGYEVARLARNNSDWYQLLDLAAVSGTLIADMDGLYDPRLYNDRLLLGLKGTMSEAELHWLRQRLDAGRLSQVRRGEYRQRLPTGLVRLADGQVVKDPDDQVRHALELVFTKFEELGSCSQVLRYFRREQILLPRRQTSQEHFDEIQWKAVKYDMIYIIITNPAYAGAFVYGRRQMEPGQRQPGRPSKGRLHHHPEEWIHVQQDVYPAYISWEQYLANQARLKQNASQWTELVQAGQGAARHGTALLQGLVICGCCGYRMRPLYTNQSPRYVCAEMNKRLGVPRCASLHAPSIDAVVVQAFFEAIQPAQLDALAAVLTEQEAERERLTRQWQERLQRAEYEVHLARRQYDAVDPDYRLVATELERRWDEKLRQLQCTREDLARFEQRLTPMRLTPELRTQLQHISETLPELWHGGQLSNVHKKELLRTLIHQVILKRETPETVSVKIVWASDHYSTFSAYPPFGCLAKDSRYPEMIDQIHTLWKQGLNDEEIAQRLTEAGFQSARTERMLASAVQRERWSHGWYDHLHVGQSAEKVGPYLTVAGMAARLGVQKQCVYRHLARHNIDPSLYIRYKGRVYLFPDEPEVIGQIRQVLPSRYQTTGEH